MSDTAKLVVSIVGTGVVVAGVLLTAMSWVRGDIAQVREDVRSDIAQVREDVRSFVKVASDDRRALQALMDEFRKEVRQGIGALEVRVANVETEVRNIDTTFRNSVGYVVVPPGDGSVPYDWSSPGGQFIWFPAGHNLQQPGAAPSEPEGIPVLNPNE